MQMVYGKALACVLIAALILISLFLPASASDYPFLTGPYGTYTVGTEGIEMYSGSWQQAVSLIEDPDCDPECYSLQADVTSLSGVDQGAGCRMGFALFADKTANAYVYLTLEGWNGNVSKGIQVNSVVGGTEKGVGNGNAYYCAFTFEPGETYRIRADVDGRNVAFSVDGERLFSIDIPDENRFGPYFGLVSCVGKANFDRLILDDFFLWTHDGKGGMPVPAETEEETVAESRTETETRSHTETETEPETEPEKETGPSAEESSRDPGGSPAGWVFWPILAGVVLVPGCASFFIFYRIAGRRSRRNGGDPQ